MISQDRVRRFLDAVGRIPNLDDWSVGDRWSGLNLVPVEGRAKRTLFVTKLAGLCGVRLHRLAPSTTLISRYGVPSPAVCERVARECPSGRLDFVGDLDPLDLTVFVVLASRLKHIEVRHRGVNAVWMQRSRKHLAVRWGGRLPSITMDRAERAHFELVRALTVDWADIIGDSALELLESGEKLELEGATNPGFYDGPKITRAIEREILRA